MIWSDSRQIRDSLEQTFNRILNERMQGLPMVNPSLSVQALDFHPAGQDWIGVLITPWFMNLLLMPGPACEWSALPPGSKIDKHFPYGTFEFTVSRETALGSYALCSLFSPMFSFENQTAALDAAKAALQALTGDTSPRMLSRRELLRGGRRNR